MEVQKSQGSITYEMVGWELYKLNLVVSYPYSDDLIEYMAKTILRVMPEVKLEILKELTDNYIMGVRKFNKDDGVSQIFRDIKTLESIKSHSDNKW